MSCTHLKREGERSEKQTHTQCPAGSSSRQLVSLHWATLVIRADPCSQSYFYWQHVRTDAPPHCQDTLPLSFLLFSLVKTSWSLHIYWIPMGSHTYTEHSPQSNFPPSKKPACLSISQTSCYVWPTDLKSLWPTDLKSQHQRDININLINI